MKKMCKRKSADTFVQCKGVGLDITKTVIFIRSMKLKKDTINLKETVANHIRQYAISY